MFTIQNYKHMMCTKRFRVEYADTDQMGVMHHSNYLKHYETGRHDFMKSLGVSYSKIENSGILMPVIRATVDYLKPAFYDQVIVLETMMALQKGPRLTFKAKMINEAGEVISTSMISLAYVNKETRKACFPHAKLKSLLTDFQSIVYE